MFIAEKQTVRGLITDNVRRTTFSNDYRKSIETIISRLPNIKTYLYL